MTANVLTVDAPPRLVPRIVYPHLPPATPLPLLYPTKIEIGRKMLKTA